jgi:hypothetical protein
MIPARAPMISAGQLYLHTELNEYMIVTGNKRGQVQYAGEGFRGHSEDQSFIERFSPVDPSDVDDAEINSLLAFCPKGTKASVGFIVED